MKNLSANFYVKYKNSELRTFIKHNYKYTRITKIMIYQRASAIFCYFTLKLQI